MADKDRPTPEELTAAWDAWRVEGGRALGPGPAFVEALTAANRARRLRREAEQTQTVVRDIVRDYQQ